jgi:hypothetical protein
MPAGLLFYYASFFEPLRLSRCGLDAVRVGAPRAIRCELLPVNLTMYLIRKN